VAGECFTITNEAAHVCAVNHEGASMAVEFLGSMRAGAAGQPLPFSPAVRAGPFVFVSGQVPMGENGEIVPGGIEAQTRQALSNVQRALTLAGCTLDDVVKATVWLDDARDFWTFNRVYAEFFAGNKPARSTTQAKLMVDAKVEIEVIAYKA
jgi:reactive intermediate/imine deaminase